MLADRTSIGEILEIMRETGKVELTGPFTYKAK